MPFNGDYADIKFLALYLLMYLVVFFTSIASPSLSPTWYTIDIGILIFSMVAIIISMLPESNFVYKRMNIALTQFYIYGTMKNPITELLPEGTPRLNRIIILSIGLGVPIIIIGLLKGAFPGLNLALLLPGTLAITASTTLSTFFSNDFIVAFFQPVIEETLRAGILDRTIAGWSATFLGIGLITFFLGLTIMFLIPSFFYIGLIILLAGGVFAYATRNRQIKGTIDPGFVNRQIGILIAAIFFGGLHAYVLQGSANFQTGIFTIIAFAIVLSEIDFALNSVVPSIILHSIWNAIAYAAGSISYIITGFLINGFLIFLLRIIYPPILSRMRRR